MKIVFAFSDGNGTGQPQAHLEVEQAIGAPMIHNVDSKRDRRLACPNAEDMRDDNKGGMGKGNVFGSAPAPTDMLVVRRELGRLTDLHKYMLEMIVMGEKPSVVAKNMNVHPQTLSVLRHSTLGKLYAEQVQQDRTDQSVDISKRFQQLAPEALLTLQDIMANENTPPSVRRGCATDILDRGKYSPNVKNAPGDNNMLGSAVMEILKDRARKAGILIEKTQGAQLPERSSTPLVSTNAEIPESATKLAESVLDSVPIDVEFKESTPAIVPVGV